MDHELLRRGKRANADARSPESGSVAGVQIRQFALRRWQLNAEDREANPELQRKEAEARRRRMQANPELRTKEAESKRRRRQADPEILKKEAEAKHNRRKQNRDLGMQQSVCAGIRVTFEYPKRQVTSAVYLAKGDLHPNRSPLRLHKETNTDEQPFRFHYCWMGFSQRELRDQHLRGHLDDKDRLYRRKSAHTVGNTSPSSLS
ncbi:hypothetical protein HPB50_000441 [Hyalomma asiaticum]|uniref:Uncharacterized protein n=1 Tax=Hyalomma asiaticum TaxID=266040 RepID=A0ACB7RL20_HYAAI|nr:hypothetical protein HPB50_000441 [Hyalomma asiaticum]